MADARGDGPTVAWARGHAAAHYADSVQAPGAVQQHQKHWIGVTPMEAELTDAGRSVPGLATSADGTAALGVREGDCYAGTRPFDLERFHTGYGGGPEGKRRYTDTLVEPMFGEPYSGGGRRPPHGRDPDEQPGMMPEILPSPDVDAAGPRDANLERCSLCRSIVVQAWGNDRTMWPVVPQQPGVAPDLGRGLEVTVTTPPGAHTLVVTATG